MLAGRLTIFCALVLFASAWANVGAGAAEYKFHSLYSFCAQANCTDGHFPYGVTTDKRGNPLGVTFEGGATGGGVLFELAKAKTSGFRVIHNFCCSEGVAPVTPPIVSKHGYIYGTTSGVGGDSALYRISPNGDVIALLTFCASCSLGGTISPLTYKGAQSGKPYDDSSPLYGTTGGGDGGGGLVFQATPNGDSVDLKILHEFCSLPCTEGTGPNYLTVADDGTIYGTSASGGAQNAGVVFQLVPTRHGNRWTETTLYQFCQQNFCADGQLPDGPLLVDGGNLIGTTQAGGDGGVVFSITPDGENSQETVLHSFCPDCGEGTFPTGGLVKTSDGDLLGVTEFSGGGSVYKLSGNTFETVYHFCHDVNCTDGDTPAASLSVSANGKIFGTTSAGGSNKGGTLFELIPKK